MSDKQLTTTLISEYTNLQRILVSSNRDAEINYQIKIIKSKLESMGVVTTDLDLDKETITV